MLKYLYYLFFAYDINNCNRLNIKLAMFIMLMQINELGGIPVLTRAADMSNTIPDEKVVITLVCFLCTRLLDLREEIHAVRTIQTAWRKYCLLQNAKLHKVLIEIL